MRDGKSILFVPIPARGEEKCKEAALFNRRSPFMRIICPDVLANTHCGHFAIGFYHIEARLD